MKNIALAFMVIVAGCVGCSTSSHQVTGTLRPAVPTDSVTVYYTMPTHARVIGTVKSDSYGGMDMKQATTTAITKMQEQAAKLGANGLYVASSDGQPLAGANLTGQAIYVSP